MNLDCLADASRLDSSVLCYWPLFAIADAIVAQDTNSMSLQTSSVRTRDGPVLLTPHSPKRSENLKRSLQPRASRSTTSILACRPLPNQQSWLLGKFHGTAEDADNRSHWRYERKADGTMLNQAIDVDKIAMEYTRRNERRRWATRGRVMYEFIKNASDDQEPLTVILIDALSEQENPSTKSSSLTKPPS